MYSSFFGFTAKPFQLSPATEFFFKSKSHKRALSYLHYGLSQGEGFIVITGEIGTGKTTLMRKLCSTLERDNLITAQLVTTRLEADDLLRMICSAFGLPAENKPKAVLLQQFQDFLLSAHLAKKRVLLLVDEAQNLSASAIEELRMLSNFQVNDTSLMQSFLLGQPELRAIIQDPNMEQFRQRVIAAFHLQPLSEVEVKAYILWRLGVVGWAENPSFCDVAFKEIYRHTKGIPRKINVFCDRLLLLCFLEEFTMVDENTVTTVAEELAEEFSPLLSHLQPPPTVGNTNHPLASITSDVSELQRKIILINKYLSIMVNEKIELLKVLDKKFKQEIDKSLEDYER
ncbi:XrtA/PEP-CTERM system-associated ATPase [Marinobacterium sedimentorum]|uniref:XrtA/PEP-CTERM system-associated ATPase n=1 Tax=Marinobacterium sedimentorum TaxID=2927804 RepID=UPI0020C5D95C|nr:XrtA/PEP-CTERM system-associated ATPase [Marinobacterium sedimentorum]MCP8686800.1 XrtA-associated ATPase [Marinobacterium sedimentorum]